MRASQNGTSRHRQASPSSESGQDEVSKDGIPQEDLQLMVKNLVRLALACEHTRSAIRREDIPKKVFVHDHKRCFARVFQLAQERLRATFGMEMVELPPKDRYKNMTMTQQRRVAHTQAGATHKQTATKTGSKSWILRNVLPPRLKRISQRQHMENDRNYNAVLMVVLIIVIMSDEQCCSENRATSFLERLKWFPTTPVGPYDEVVSKMARQGYIERIKDDQSADGAYNLHVGPRGKLETLQNREELFSVISRVYGHEDDETAQERLQRIIRDTLENEDENLEANGEAAEGEEAEEALDRRRKRLRRSDVNNE